VRASAGPYVTDTNAEAFTKGAALTRNPGSRLSRRDGTPFEKIGEKMKRSSRGANTIARMCCAALAEK